MRPFASILVFLGGIMLNSILTPSFALDMKPMLQTVAKAQIQLLACDTTRPIICQQTYDPVCAIFIKPSTKTQTFRNACLACQNREVQGYERGKCLKDLKR